MNYDFSQLDNKKQDEFLFKKVLEEDEKNRINTHNFLKNTSGLFGVLLATIGYVLFTFFFVYIASKITNINYLDYFLMILIISPALHINELLAKEHNGIKTNFSKFFTRFNIEFKSFAFCLPFIILYFLYKYWDLNGIINTFLLFSLSLLFQRGFYLYIRYYIKSEFMIFGLQIIGLILFVLLLLK